jgi:membrane-associated phospholipid phosphatase
MRDGRILESITWTICATIGVVVLIWVGFSDFRIAWSSGLVPAGFLVLLSGLGWIYSRWRPDERIATTLTGLTQLILFTGVGAPLSYLMASLGLPFWDATLLAWDRALGLDWLAYLGFVNGIPALGITLKVAYLSIVPQMVIVLAALGLTGRTRDLRLFVAAVTVTGITTVVISGLMPAMAMFVHLGLTAGDYPNLNPAAAFVHKAAMYGLRDGSLRVLFLNDGEGIITFPSYHAALAVVFLCAFWSLPWLRWPGSVLNILMIAATPIDGGHYFVDVLFGIALAFVTIAALTRIASREPAPARLAPASAVAAA